MLTSLISVFFYIFFLLCILLTIFQREKSWVVTEGIRQCHGWKKEGCKRIRSIKCMKNLFHQLKLLLLWKVRFDYYIKVINSNLKWIWFSSQACYYFIIILATLIRGLSYFLYPFRVAQSSMPAVLTGITNTHKISRELFIVEYSCL